MLAVPRDFAGLSAFVTGGGSGMGLATAELLAARNAAHVTLVDRDEERLARAAERLAGTGADVATIALDLSDPAACEPRLAAAFAERPHELVASNAGWLTKALNSERELTSWDAILAVNLTAGALVAKHAARALIAAGRGGAMVFTASIGGLGGSPAFAPYNAAKAGTINLVQSLALELAPHGIRVNATSPGPTDTAMGDDLMGRATFDRMRADFSASPLGRLARADEQARVIAFLLSEEASFMTGANVVVDGGLTCRSTGQPMPWHADDA